MRRLFMTAALLLAACGDNLKATLEDAGADASSTDAPPTGALTSCVDRPTDLARPPTGGLSCDMLPPGLTLEAP